MDGDGGRLTNNKENEESIFFPSRAVYVLHIPGRKPSLTLRLEPLPGSVQPAMNCGLRPETGN
jgi:hypothetical protein